MSLGRFRFSVVLKDTKVSRPRAAGEQRRGGFGVEISGQGVKVPYFSKREIGVEGGIEGWWRAKGISELSSPRRAGVRLPAR